MALARSIPTATNGSNANADSLLLASGSSRHSPLTRPRRLSSTASSPVVSTLSTSATGTTTRSSTRRPSSSSSNTASGPRARSSSKNRTNGSAILLGSSYESSRESKFDRLFGSGSGRGASAANASYNEETFEEDDDAGYSSSLGNKMKKFGTGTRGRRDSSTSTVAAAGTSPASNATVGLDGSSEYSASYKAASKVGKGSKEKDLLRCEMCHKVYHHPQSLIKHRWQHTEQWHAASSLGMSKHQTVQALEAATILANPEALRLLPEDRSHWPAAVSPPTSGLLGSDQLNIDVLRNTGPKYSQSMPIQRSRLGSMLAQEQDIEEEESVLDGENGVKGEMDDSTDSESDFGMENDDLPKREREDTELAGMDQEMFSLDLQSANGSQAGTPASKYAQLPDVGGVAAPPSTRSSSGLSYTRQVHNGQNGSASSSRFSYGNGIGGLQTIPSQVSMTAFASAAAATDAKQASSQRSHYPGYHGSYRSQSHASHKAGGGARGRETSAAPSSSDRTTSSSSSNHSEAGGETVENSSSILQQQNKKQGVTPSPSRATSSNMVPNLSISAPVLGFFTEQNPPTASVVSPLLGPTKMTSPLLQATKNSHLAPVPALDSPGAAGNGYSPAEAAAAEVLSTSHNSNKQFDDHRAALGHGSPYAPGAVAAQIPSSHGRSMSNGRSFAPSSSPYARSPFERPSLIGSYSQTRSFSASAQREVAESGGNGNASGAVYGTSFGQAPLASSYRSSSYVGAGQSPALRPVQKASPPQGEEAEQAGEDDDIMDMDL